MHDQAFLLNIGVALGAGLLGGLLARLVRMPPIVGYLAAGVAIGPHTPGVFAHEGTVRDVANLGVMLLMFAVGVQFSLDELKDVGKTALVAGLIQISGTILLGIGLGVAFGWGLYGGLFLGCALSLSSTAVVMRILEDRGEVSSTHGSVIIGIAVVQDLSLILMAAVLPSLSQIQESGADAVTGVLASLFWAALFLAAVLFLAARGVPWLLDRVAGMRSRELFLLTVIVICLGAAAGAEMAALGLPLGAFMAGLIISESEYAHEVFAQIRPLRDVFAALFFVSVGMLLDPSFLAGKPGMILAVVTTTVAGKALFTLFPVFLLTKQMRVALFSGLGLAQIGEFSFVLATLGISRGLIPGEISAVLVTVALVTILLTPPLFGAVEPLYRWMNRDRVLSRFINREAAKDEKSHRGSAAARVLVLGYGRVGRYVSDALKAKDVPQLVIEYDAKAVERCRRKKIPVMFGDASSLSVLERARSQEAELAVVALPEAGMTEMAIRNLKTLSPDIQVVARVHRGAFVPGIRKAGADDVIHAEFEASTEMIRQGLDRLGFSDAEVDDYLDKVREARYRLWES